MDQLGPAIGFNGQRYVSIPYGAIGWINLPEHVGPAIGFNVSIPYGAIGWINRARSARGNPRYSVSIPYGAIGWINVSPGQRTPNAVSFNPLRGNWVDQRLGEIMPSWYISRFNPLRGNWVDQLGFVK